MIEEVYLKWTSHPHGTEYFLDEKSMGLNDEGFLQLLKTIAALKKIKRIIIYYPVAGSVGGKSVEEDFPFLKYYPELLKTAQLRRITLEWNPVFN